jgi:hypothetical protein
MRTTYDEFQCSITIIPQGNLTFVRKIKHHIWQWKGNEDCSRSEVSCVILIIWVTAAITYNEAQLFHWGLIIFWHNPTAHLYACLILARFLQLSWQRLGFWILLAVELVTLQVLCHWARSAKYVGFSLSFQQHDCSKSLSLLFTVWSRITVLKDHTLWKVFMPLPGNSLMQSPQHITVYVHIPFSHFTFCKSKFGKHYQILCHDARSFLTLWKLYILLYITM